MKRLVFLASLLFALNGLAQHNRNLVILSGTGEPVQVYVNERLVNEQPLKELRVSGLTDNYYDVKIRFANQPRKTMYASLYIPPLSEIVYEIFASDRRRPRGDFLIKEIYPIDDQLPYYQPDVVFPWAVNTPQNSPIGTVQQNGQININNNNNSNANNTDVSESQVVYVPGYQGKIGCKIPVSTEKFENMFNAVKNEGFESSKLRVAKQIIKMNNCLTVPQLVKILGLFDFDDSRLKLAKYAYDYIYDLEDFNKVYSVFDYESNKRQLEKYIKDRD